MNQAEREAGWHLFCSIATIFNFLFFMLIWAYLLEYYLPGLTFIVKEFLSLGAMVSGCSLTIICAEIMLRIRFLKTDKEVKYEKRKDSSKR